MLNRRLFLSGVSTAFAAMAMPRIAFAKAATERRFVFIIQRGAADGLATLAPVGDPAFHSIRASFAEDAAAGTRLDGFFALHPALAQTARLYAAKQALFVHAVASPYRDRSHFDGQNVLETGGTAAYRLKDGWMNRLLGLIDPAEAKALALSPTVPTVLRGSREVASYAPSQLPSAPDDLMARVGAMYHSDAQLHGLWSEAVQTRSIAGDTADERGQNGAVTGALAAKMLSGAEGARIAVIETTGWDTHSNQRGRLATGLKSLDAMIAALRDGLGPNWGNTLVIAATEFGRTVAPNGTGGTDHGTASAAMLMGGAVAGGRVIADWPGLSNAALYDGRDLKPTADLDAVIASALAQHYGLEPARVMTTLFPEGRSAPSAKVLVKAGSGSV